MSTHTITTDGRAEIRVTITPLDGEDVAAKLAAVVDPRPILAREPWIGAVVEDADGVRHFHADDVPPSWMRCGDSIWVHWEDIRTPVRLLLRAE